MPVLFRDCETNSTLDLGDVGAWRYSYHATTDVWCLGYCVDGGEIKIWTPGNPVPPEIIEAANNPDFLVAAFNDAFERCIEQHIMAPRYGFPLVPVERHRCLQAVALSLALPGSLDGAATALMLEHQKDAEGHRLMLQMARPRKPRKGEDPGKIYWHDDLERQARLYDYCKRDVAAERELHQRIGFLSAEEQALWVLDQAINDCGISIDRELLDAAIKIAGAAQEELSVEIKKITAGAVGNVHQTARLLDWLAANGCNVSDLRKPTLEKALVGSELSPDCRRLIELRLDGAHAAAAKLVTMRNWLNPDNRVRGTLKFHGASTGRWSGHGVQLQNIKRPLVKDIDAAIEAVRIGSLDHLRRQYQQPMSVVGDITRALICAQPGHQLIAADFSGVESRITAWLSGQQSKLDQWAKFDRTGKPEDEPYFIIGRDTFGIAEEQARAIGKTGDLAFGYMGGIGAWRKLAPEDTSTDDQIKRRQRAWRQAHKQTWDFWTALNTRAAQAVLNPGELIRFQRAGWRHISFKSDGQFLRMLLPSGRAIAYPFPRIKPMADGKPSVIFMDASQGKWAECRNGEGCYGGIWLENAVQAVARDLFAAAMIRLEAAGYRITLHVHDEIVAEMPDGAGSGEEFLRILTTAPEWAAGLPIAAKVREGPRFCKSSVKAAAAEEPASAEPDENHHTTDESTIGGNGYDRNEARAFNGYASGERLGGRNVAEYIYLNKDREPYLKVRRTSEKQFPQFHPENGRWVKGAPKGPKIPYRLPELLAAAPDMPVFVCEGEKDADNVAALGLVATTNSGGAGKWSADLNRWFDGKQAAYVLEDNDGAGRAHARKVADSLHGIVSDIRIVSFTDLPEHGDVSDWAETGGTREQLIERAKAAPKYERPALPFINMSNWDNEEPPPREWAVPDRIPLYQTTLFSGEGAAGKSMLQLQLSFAHTLTREWLCTKPAPGPALYVDAEDDSRELHRRGAQIISYYGASWDEAIKGGLHLLSFAGKDAVLAVASRNGKVEPTTLYNQLLQAAGDIKPKMIGIASAANVFAGLENDRSQVQQFIGLLTRMAILAGGAVQLISHPSLTGINTDTGLSGNTQWHNAVRARSYLKSVKPEAGEQPDSDLREIVFKKNNYGPITDSIVLRWQDGLFLPVFDAGSLDQAAREELAQEVFLTLLKRFRAQNRYVSDKASVSYAPALFVREQEAKSAGLSGKNLEAAMRQLFKAGTIWNEPYGKPSRPSYRIAVK
jgi:DNA polymerase